MPIEDYPLYDLDLPYTRGYQKGQRECMRYLRMQWEAYRDNPPNKIYRSSVDLERFIDDLLRQRQ